MISKNIKQVVTAAIRADNSANKKWLEAGKVVASEYANREALEAIRAQFIDEVIYPAMGDDAVRVMRAEVPRANGKEDIGASTELRAEWAAMREDKKTIRGMGSVYFGRVVKYAFPKVEGEEGETGEEGTDPKAAKSPRGRIAARLGEAQTMIQKQEALAEHDKVLLAAIAAWQTAEAKPAK